MYESENDERIKEELSKSVLWKAFKQSHVKPKYYSRVYTWWDGKLIRTKHGVRIPDDYVEDPPRSKLPDEQRCVSPVRTCVKCKHRYTKEKDGSVRWYCPECGEPRRCKAKSLTGKTRCAVHSSKGFIKPKLYEDGRRCYLGRRESLPQRMLESYDMALTDRELLILRRDLALVEARLVDLLDRADTGESGRIWKDLKTIWDSFMQATRSGEEQTAQAHLMRVHDLIVEGNQDYDTWNEISALVEQRKRLAESERKRLLEMHQMISTERVMALMERIALVIERHVDDTKTRRKIGQDIKRLVEDNATVSDSAVNILPITRVQSEVVDERVRRITSPVKTIELIDS